MLVFIGLQALVVVDKNYMAYMHIHEGIFMRLIDVGAHSETITTVYYGA